MVQEITSLSIFEELKYKNNSYAEDIKRICKIFVDCSLISITINDLVANLGYQEDVNYGALMIQLALSFGHEHGLIEMINEDAYTLTDKGWLLGIN